MNIFDKFPYIVVEGPIGSGKSTLAQILADRFSVNFLSEKAEKNPFLPKFYEDMKRYALSTQLFFLFQRADQIQKISQKDMFKKSIIADFFLEKDPIFATLTLDDDELHLYRQLYDHFNQASPRADLVIYLQAAPATLNERIRRRGVQSEEAISENYLERVCESYSRFFHHYDTSPLLIVNTEHLNPVENSEDFDLLMQRIFSMRGKREFFNRGE